MCHLLTPINGRFFLIVVDMCLPIVFIVGMFIYITTVNLTVFPYKRLYQRIGSTTVAVVRVCAAYNSAPCFSPHDSRCHSCGGASKFIPADSVV